MSETPRTDAAAEYDGFAFYVKADFARQLERELTAAQARIAEMEGVIDDYERSISAGIWTELRASRLRIAQLEDTVRRLSEPNVLDAPARVDHAIYSAGTHTRAVIEMAQCEYERSSNVCLSKGDWPLPCRWCERVTYLLDTEGRPECLRADCVEQREQ